MSAYHTHRAAALVEQGRAAILDAHTPYVTDAIREVPAAEAQQVLLALAMIAGHLAMEIEDSKLRLILAGYFLTTDETEVAR